MNDFWESLKELRPIDRKASDQVLIAIKNERLNKKQALNFRLKLLTAVAAVMILFIAMPKNSTETNYAYDLYQEATQAW